MQKINRVNLRHLKIRPLSEQDSLETVMEVVNLAYIIEIGNTGLAFKELDRLRSVEDLVREETHVAVLGKEIVGVVGCEVKEGKVFIGENHGYIFYQEIILFSPQFFPKIGKISAKKFLIPPLCLHVRTPGRIAVTAGPGGGRGPDGLRRDPG